MTFVASVLSSLKEPGLVKDEALLECFLVLYVAFNRGQSEFVCLGNLLATIISF